MKKFVVLTGASGALGTSIAKCLSSAGYGVIGVARDLDRISEIDSFYSVVQADLSNLESLIASYKQIIGNTPDVYGLVNNAAIGTTSLNATQNTEEISRVLQVNLLAPIMLSKLFGRKMLEQGRGGRIVMISSIASVQAYKGLAVYSATKAGLEAYARTLARELGSHGITVNSVLPGFMETPMTSALSSEQLTKIKRRSALGGELELDSVSNMVKFLLTDSARQITGESIRVDLGASL